MHLHRIQSRPQVKVIIRSLRPDAPVSPPFRLFTQVHLLIDGSVESQYVTIWLCTEKDKKQIEDHLTSVRLLLFPTDTITDAGHTDDQALFPDTPAQAKSLLHSLRQAAGGLGFYVNANTTKIIHFKREETISFLSGRHVQFEDKFPCLGSNISFTSSDINLHLANALTAIETSSNIWKFDFFSTK